MNFINRNILYKIYDITLYYCTLNCVRTELHATALLCTELHCTALRCAALH